ncbi:MAG: pirin family protein [SAR202 cluster bacterium]|nr:pirin family protein [SAR202 cluster bacterium]
MKINVDRIIKPIPTSDGAGVKLKRSIGTHHIDYFDPFLMLDEFGSENKRDYIDGFPPHPHRGIETVTYMLSGEFRHEDSSGNKGDMRAGSVQWMTAAGGIIHSEMPIMKEGKLHGFQLWVNMPAKLKMSKPKYQNIDSEQIPLVQEKDKHVKVIAGDYNGQKGPISGLSVEPLYLDVELNKDSNFEIKLLKIHNSFIYLIEGQIEIGDKKHDELFNSTLITLTKGEELKVKAITKSKFLVVSGKPINEPIARGGPFVMNTKAEILQAIQDYHNGTFVK